MSGQSEIYQPRDISDLGLWDIGPVWLKVYGIAAAGQSVSAAVIADAKALAEAELPQLIAAEGDDNGLGFALIHCGETGVTISLYWWVHGCVLCQHIKRTLYGADRPLKFADRPVIACVWELELINAEQMVWQKTMMIPTPDPEAYKKTRIQTAV
ncbi:hypothetical protein [Roseibium algae]|uniref:Uncharacterized protein n=1 Tax=Roseibium algae TaxID=3123038 RepID=A0ABU8TLT0_9HYPH